MARKHRSAVRLLCPRRAFLKFESYQTALSGLWVQSERRRSSRRRSHLVDRTGMRGRRRPSRCFAYDPRGGARQHSLARCVLSRLRQRHEGYRSLYARYPRGWPSGATPTWGGRMGDVGFRDAAGKGGKFSTSTGDAES